MKVIGNLCGILVIAVSLISCSKEDVSVPFPVNV